MSKKLKVQKEDNTKINEKVENNRKKYNILKIIGFSLLFIFFASAPLMWFTRIAPYELLGSADFLSPFNLQSYAYSRFFVYEPFFYNGTDTSFLISHLFPLLSTYLVASSLGMQPGITTLVFLFLILLIAEVSMYFYLRYILMDKLKSVSKDSKILSFFGAVLYALSPYIVPIIQPGHFLQLLLYATMPIILMLVDQIFSEKSYNFRKYIFLFFLFFLNASGFANIGIMYVLFIILGLYCIPLIFKKQSLIRNISKFILVIFTAILSNIWWLFPFFASIKQTVSINESSDAINTALNLATEKASIVNLFLGRGENMLYQPPKLLPTDFYTSFYLFIIFVLILFFMCYTLINNKKSLILIQLLIVITGAIFISKGPNPPFGEFFLFLYGYFPGFQIFRRPVSKFYWVFLLAVIPLAIVGMANFLHKTRNYLRKLIYVFMGATALYLLAIFALTPLMTPFTVPDYYYQAKNYLEKNNVNRVVLLPGFYGTYPTYDKSLNNYYGVDFIPYIWNFSLFVPDTTTYSPNLLYKKPLNQMIAAMKEEKPFCNQAQALGITHIVVRQDIDLANPIEDKPADIINVLNSSPEVEMPTMFSSNTSKGITIYPLKDNCTIKNMVSLNGSNRNVSYNMVNPVKYEIEVSQIKNGDTLELLNNFHYGWKIYGNNNLMQSYDNKNTYRPHNLFEDLGDVRLLFNESYNEANHKVTRDYANGWKIDINELAKVSEVKENNDGTYTIRVIAYYNLQNYFYIGLIIFVTISILIVSYMLYSYSVKKSHHKKNDKIDSYNR